MAISTNNTFLYSSGPISFGSLRSDFKETTSGPVSASELKRNTTVDATQETNPIVPDCVENADISSGNNLKTSQFRDSLKYYNLVQTGTDDNSAAPGLPAVDVASEEWFGNLGKNIKKRFYVQGTIGSVAPDQPAAKFEDLAYNLSMIIENGGKVLGAGGASGSSYSTSGASGGTAIYSSSTGYAVKIQLNASAQVYGGGAGGARGSQGITGNPGTCNYTYWSGGYCGGGPNNNCPSGGYKVGGSGGGDGNCCEFRRGCNVGRWYNLCQVDYSVSGGPGGAGGVGGAGQGYNQTNASGAGGGGGTSGGCPNTGGTGYPGEPGAPGALFGSNTSATTITATGTLVGNGGPQGTGGRAIGPVSGNYIYTGELTSETIKGLYQ